jgi:peptidoglycan/LPS O-acetylase OafA/YrhL
VTRVPALDGVRGLAIALVVLLHTGLVPGGWIGVSLFFALSGYLITGLLLGEHDRSSTIRLRSFYRRRLARLAPALIVALVGMVALWALTIPDQTNLAVADAIVTLAYLANIVRAISPAWMVPAGWAWSLSIEEQFYLLWPLTLRAALRRVSRERLATILTGLALALMIARLFIPHPYVIYSVVRCDELLLGSALALTAWRPSRHLITAGVVGFVALLALPEAHQAIAITLGTLGSVSVLLLAERGWFSVHPLRALGRISYSLYLWNGILCGAWFAKHDHHMPRGWAALTITAASVLIATCSTLWLEEPLRRRLAHPKVLARDRAVQPRVGAVQVESDVSHSPTEESLRVVGAARVDEVHPVA